MSALGIMREALIAAVASVSAHYRRSAAGSFGWTFEMICAACHASDEAIDAALVLVNHAPSGILPRDTFLLAGLVVALKKLDGSTGPTAVGGHGANLWPCTPYGRDIREDLAALQVVVGVHGGLGPTVYGLSSALAGRSCRWT